MHYLLGIVCGYLLGSIPTAFLMVKRTAGIDIREAGSGNVGGFNTYEVTKSKKASGIVILMDAVKGFVGVLLAGYVREGDPWFQGVVFLAILIGHIFPVWLGFRGGRGLASAAGGFFAIGLGYAIVWCLIWFTAKRSTGDILKGNIVASALTPIVLWIMPGIAGLLMINGGPIGFYLQFSVVLSVLLLLSHFKPLRRWAEGKPTL